MLWMKNGWRNFLRKQNTSVSFIGFTAVVSASLMICALVFAVCNYYKARNENPYSDYYRLLVDRSSLAAPGQQAGYSSEDRMYCGFYPSIRRIHEYFYDIVDYTAELTAIVYCDAEPFVPPGAEDSGNVSLYALTDCMELMGFARGELTLAEGRFLTQSDRREQRHVCMVHEQFALMNGLKLGSTLKVRSKKKAQEETELRIVGIYRDSASLLDSSVIVSYQSPVNRIYVPLFLLERQEFTGVAAYNYQILPNDRARIPEIERFINEYGMAEGNPARLIPVSEIFEANNRSVRALLRGFEMVRTLVTGVAFALMFGFVFSVVRSRRREIGICFALGESKRSVALSLSAELCFSALVGLAVSSAFLLLAGFPLAERIYTLASAGGTAESIRNTTSDYLYLAGTETETFRSFLNSGFLVKCIGKGILPVLLVLVSGLCAAVYGVFRIDVMRLLSEQEDR